jgi:hypothetical protein
MFKVTDTNGNAIYFKNERDAQRERKTGDTVTRVPYKSRGYLHNDND